MYFIIQCFGKGIFTPVIAPCDDQTNMLLHRLRLKTFATKRLAAQHANIYCKSICTIIKLEESKFK